MSVATLASVVNWLDQGTGDPGLAFDDYDNTTTEIVEIREAKESDLWMVHPVTVINSVDGSHELCALFITFCFDEDGRSKVVFGAIDQKGEPCAWHSV